MRGPPPAVVGLPGGMRIKTPVRSKRNSGEYSSGGGGGGGDADGGKTLVRSKRNSGEYAGGGGGGGGGGEGRVRWAA